MQVLTNAITQDSCHDHSEWKIKQAADWADSVVLSPHQSVRAAMGQRDDNEKGQKGWDRLKQTNRDRKMKTGSQKKGIQKKKKGLQEIRCTCGSRGVRKAEPLTLFLSRCSGAATCFRSDPCDREEGGRPTPCHAPPSPLSPPDPSCVVRSSPLPDDWHTGEEAALLNTQSCVLVYIYVYIHWYCLEPYEKYSDNY